MGKKEVKVQFPIKGKKEVKEGLTKLADKDNRSFSGLCSHILECYLENKSLCVVQRSELFFKFIDEHYSHSSEIYRKELKESFSEYLKNYG